MNEHRPIAGSWPAIDEKTLRQFDKEGLKRCCGDAALWIHYRALLEGEFRIRSKGEAAWKGWLLAKKLAQYKVVEASVIEGWQKFITNSLGISKGQQTDATAINRAIIFDGCRRARNEHQVAEMLKQRAQSIYNFAACGDVPFFRSFGRLLGPLSHSSLRMYDYAHAILGHWLTSYLWLMPERTASDCLAGWRGQKPKTAKEGDKELRHFKETKREYNLKSHKPSLVHHIEVDGRLILTPQGRIVFRSLIPPSSPP